MKISKHHYVDITRKIRYYFGTVLLKIKIQLVQFILVICLKDSANTAWLQKGRVG
jgi:hypothetical protein